jgi:hypothetical protein
MSIHTETQRGGAATKTETEDRRWRIEDSKSGQERFTRSMPEQAEGSTKEENIFFPIRCPLRYPVFATFVVRKAFVEIGKPKIQKLTKEQNNENILNAHSADCVPYYLGRGISA